MQSSWICGPQAPWSCPFGPDPSTTGAILWQWLVFQMQLHTGLVQGFQGKVKLAFQQKGKFFSSKSPAGPQKPTPTAGDLQPGVSPGTTSFQGAWNSHPTTIGLEGTLESDPSPFQTSPPTHPPPSIGSSGLDEGRNTSVNKHSLPGAAHSVVTQHKELERSSLYQLTHVAL